MFATIRDKFRERTSIDTVHQQECFRIMGKNRNIDINILKNLLTRWNFDLSKNELISLFNEFDYNCDGYINLTDILEVCNNSNHKG